MNDHEGLPPGFRPQVSGLSRFASLVEQAPDEIVAYLREHPAMCKKALMQSYNKRYVPSTYIEEAGDNFCVGWFDAERSHARVFTDIGAAVADYLLFSFGKGRLPLNAAHAHPPHIGNDSAQVKSLRPGNAKNPWWKFWVR